MAGREIRVFVLKDENNNYASCNSIRFDRENKRYYYMYSTRLSNGFHTYDDEAQAQEQLELLTELAKEIRFEKEFHIEHIDRYQVLLYEKTLPKEDYPFKREEINQGKATSVA